MNQALRLNKPSENLLTKGTRKSLLSASELQPGCWVPPFGSSGSLQWNADVVHCLLQEGIEQWFIKWPRIGFCPNQGSNTKLLHFFNQIS